MTPEVINLIDKISFTGALLIAVYMLYRDSRSDDRTVMQQNAENIKLLAVKVDQLATMVQLLLEYEQRQNGDTKPLPSVHVPIVGSPARRA